jgi:hypothetical protein
VRRLSQSRAAALERDALAPEATSEAHEALGKVVAGVLAIEQVPD